MEKFIWIALLITVAAATFEWTRLHVGKSVKFSSLVFGIVSFVFITMALGERGEVRGACPLSDPGEVFLFVAWSLSLFYVLSGGAYRMSLLGVFTWPLVTLFLGMVLVPGMLTENPVKHETLDAWKESHAATSVLSYGALGLGALAGGMFLLLDKRLKAQRADWISMKMPPVNTLVSAMHRLLWIGVAVLSLGIVAGVMSSIETAFWHLVIAGGVWVAYLTLLIWYKWKGLPPKYLALWAVGLFVVSCGIFFVI